ncbi:DENR protein, partial [Polyodon spathula]|nr:DENR protein [Polyodon spathula]
MATTENAESGSKESNVDRRKANSDTKYPLKVLYCGVCSLPTEYCEYMPEPAKCRQWLEKNFPDEFAKLSVGNCPKQDAGGGEPPAAGEEEEKKKQKRGGRGQIKQKKKTVPQKITIAKIPRAKKKYVTRVCGLATFEIDLKEAQRFFAQKFSCGASATAEDEIIIQGDFTDDIIDVIQEKWPEQSASETLSRTPQLFLMALTSNVKEGNHSCCIFSGDLLSSVLPPLLIVEFALGVLGNGIALWIFCFHFKPWKTSTVYLFNLALADFLLNVVLPFRTDYYLRNKDWIFGDVFCSISLFLLTTNRAGSILFLTAVAVDRYFKVVHPHHAVNTMALTKAVYTACVRAGKLAQRKRKKRENKVTETYTHTLYKGRRKTRSQTPGDARGRPGEPGGDWIRPGKTE